MNAPRLPVLRAAQVQEEAHTLLRPPSRAEDSRTGGLRQRDDGAAQAAQAAQAALLEQLRQEAYAAGVEAGRGAAFEEGRRAGRAEGAAQGRAAALDEFRKQIALVDAMLTRLQADQRALHAAAEDDLVALAYGAACRLVGETVVSESGARAALAAGLAQLRTRPLLALRVHPDDLDALQGDDDVGAMLARHGAADRLQWRADAQVALGGVIFETADGSLDARLETQLDALRTTLLAAREASGRPREAT